jgi:hypothetical protein
VKMQENRSHKHASSSHQGYKLISLLAFGIKRRDKPHEESNALVAFIKTHAPSVGASLE